ncbi:MAG: HDOD domain-containing protein [Rhodocyclaceae bacterium]|nr:HDOD domain-containing protein [Rhodocyclaceae bacterium]
MTSTVLITREPIINRNQAITANRLVVHATNVADAVETLDSLADIWPRHYAVFVSLARLVPTPELMRWQAPNNTMIEVPVQALDHPHTRQLIDHLIAQDIGICLSWYRENTRLPAELNCRFTLVDIRKDMNPHDAPGIPIAWGLQDEDAFQQAIENGFGGASGLFFLRYDPDNADFDLAYNYAKIVYLVTLLHNQADIRDIECLLQQDVALAWYLLRRINSYGFDIDEEIRSFRDAVNVLGYQQLSQWLHSQIATISFTDTAAVFMQTALARGHFMEEIAGDRFDEEGRKKLFITGSFSLLSDRIGALTRSAIANIPLPEDVLEALADGKGPYAPYLKLARACEQFSPTVLQQQANELGIPYQSINRALINALETVDALQSSQR